MRRRPGLHEEQGIALTVAICSLALMITLGGVALNQAISALRQSGKQTHIKRALQAADAAVDAAMYAASRGDVLGTLNIDPTDPSSLLAQTCIVTVGEVGGTELPVPDIDLVGLDLSTALDANGRRWCPTSGDETVGDGSSFSYRLSQLVRAGAGECGSSNLVTLDREVVGVGRSGKVVRRVKAKLSANISLLSGAAVQASSDSASPAALALSGTARILGDAQSNGTIAGTGANVISGNATPGDGHTVTGVVPAGSDEPACQKFTIPSVDQGNAPTVNNNGLITAAAEECVVTGTMLKQLPSCTLPIIGRTGRRTWNATNRTLLLEGNARVILTGATYSFCSLTMRGNAILQVPASNPQVRIFMDDPANCPGVTNAGQISVTEQARIVNCHLQTAPQTLQIYGVGSTSTSTTQSFSGAGLLSSVLRGAVCGVSLGSILGEPMTIIAPNSRVELGGNTGMSGQLAAKTVSMSGTSSVNPINALANLDKLGSRPVLPLYKPTDYIECTGRDFDELPAAEPAQGC